MCEVSIARTSLPAETHMFVKIVVWRELSGYENTERMVSCDIMLAAPFATKLSPTKELSVWKTLRLTHTGYYNSRIMS